MITESEIDELFAQTLAGDYDDESPWQAVRQLHNHGNRAIFDRALQWSSSPDPIKRARAADIIAQLGRTATNREPFFPDESLSTLARMVASETDPRPLASAIYGAGHFGDASLVPSVCTYKSHPDPGVRYAAAFALGCFPDDPAAIQALLFLMTDTESDVRDWATFGLGTRSDADSAEIRNALTTRLTDPDEATREEAAMGLAKRNDARVIPHLMGLMQLPEPTNLTFEAAALILNLNESESKWPQDEYLKALRLLPS